MDQPAVRLTEWAGNSSQINEVWVFVKVLHLCKSGCVLGVDVGGRDIAAPPSCFSVQRPGLEADLKRLAFINQPDRPFLSGRNHLWITAKLNAGGEAMDLDLCSAG